MRTLKRHDPQLHGECTGFPAYEPPLTLTPSLVVARFLQGIERARCHSARRFGYPCTLINERLHVVAQQFCLHLKHLGKSAGTQQRLASEVCRMTSSA